MVNCFPVWATSPNRGLDVPPLTQTITHFNSLQGNQPKEIILKVFSKRASHQLPMRLYSEGNRSETLPMVM